MGFTVSLFIAGLSFPGSEALTDHAKIGILVASVVAAALGVVVLLLSAPRHDDEPPEGATTVGGVGRERAGIYPN